MAETFVARGDRAYVDDNFEEAIQMYTEAINASPTNANAYEARAKAYIKQEQYIEAVGDCNKALEINPGFAKAYLQKGIASFQLDEFESAKEAFELGLKLDSSIATFKTWIRKCDVELQDEGSQPVPVPAEVAKAHTNGVPKATPLPKPSAPLQHPEAAAASSSNSQPTAQAPAAASSSELNAALAPAAIAALTFEGKYRYQHYQIQDKVMVDIYAKNKKKDQVIVDFQPSHLTITINDDAGQEEYKLDQELYGEVVPASCRFEVLKSKIEISMKKASTAIAWPTLEKSNKVAAANYSTPEAAPAKYPTSKKNAADWDKVEHEIKEAEEKGELDDGDPLNNFFKKIFSGGDEDQRRAMMKSFQESNGTVLSTNWEDVGAKKVECTPPDGMVVKKWET